MYIKKIFFFLCLSLLLFNPNSIAQEKKLASGQINSADANAQELFNQGFLYFKTYYKDQKNYLNKAIQLFEKSLSLSPKDKNLLFEIYHRLSFAYARLSTRDIAKSKDEKLVVLKKSQLFADMMIETDPDRPEGYFWKASSIALFGELKGIIASIGSLNEITKNYKKCIEKDPKYSISLTSLGAIYQQLPSLFGGGDKKAMNYYDDAIKANPNFAWTYKKKAELLIKKKEYELARETLKKGISLTPENECWPWDFIAFERDRLIKLLNEIKNK